MTTVFKAPTVAEYLAEKISTCGKTEQEIAEAIGYSTASVVHAFTHGTAKVPINKIGLIARFLEIDSVYFLRLVMGEYMPDVLQAIDETLQGSTLSRNERELLDAYRRVTDGTDATAVICDAKDVVAMIMV